MKMEDKEKNDVIANNNINMNDIINLINDNDLQKKKKENNVMIFGLKVTKDDIVTD
jgi:hypothetical protein